MELKNNLFELESSDVSNNIYEGKVIKCLIAPHHTFNDLKDVVPYTKSTFLFPEREMNSTQLRSFVSMLVKSDIQDEIRIITSNQDIILDMINTNCRILTGGGKVVECPEKTFMANIHTIKYEIIENELYK